MRWSRTLQTVDVHCAGEIGRVVTGGVVNIPGATMAEKLHHLNTQDDSLRKLLCSEPRSGPAGSFCLLLPACDPAADVGFIVLQPDQAHAMSGSNAMCATTALLETGMIPMQEPVSVVTLDTAAGLVRATAACKDGKVTKVTLDMPPSFVAQKDAVLGMIRDLEEKGGQFRQLTELSDLFRGNYDRLLTEYEKVVNDVTKELTYTNTVVYPEVSDKKVYPVRWVIVSSVTFSALFLCFVLLLWRDDRRLRA